MALWSRFCDKKHFIESSGCNLLFILNIFDLLVVLLQVNVYADKNCENFFV